MTPFDYMRRPGSRRIDVQGRRAVYSVSGEGYPVVFLHGWGLAEHAYAKALQRLVDQGCKVYAPAMPGFGGTAELPPDDRTIAGYAAWVNAFMDAAGIHDPAVIIGHSFGGGIAIRVAHDFPGTVRYLVLLNSVGGPSSSVAKRPVWQWALHLVRDLNPLDHGLAVARTVAEDFIPNLIRNPAGLWEISKLARAADLTAELEELGRRSVPVLMLWADHDRVLPIGLFESACKAIGAEGRVVPGRHSWLLTDPDAFGEVMENVVDMAARLGTVADLEPLLTATSLPKPLIAELLDGASALWLMSEPAPVLAGDLVLCHPKLRKGEVRAVARPMEAEGRYRLTVVAPDRPGLLADTATVVSAEGLSIVDAAASTWTDRGIALHALIVEAPEDFAWDDLGARLQSMEAGEIPRLRYAPVGRAVVKATAQGTGRSLVTITAPDQIGLLSATCRWFSVHGVNIEACRITSTGGVAQDEYIVSGAFDPEALAYHLTSPTAPLRKQLAFQASAIARMARDVLPIPRR